MPTLTYIEHDGSTRTVEGAAGRSLMQLALDHSVAGILGDCGGACSCATCHGYIDERWAAALPPMSETESFMLDGVPERHANSRLCCQLKLTAELDGVVIRLPAEQV